MGTEYTAGKKSEGTSLNALKGNLNIIMVLKYVDNAPANDTVPYSPSWYGTPRGEAMCSARNLLMTRNI